MKRVLFVDDEPKVLEALQRILRPYRCDWEMVFVSSGAAALEALSVQSFDVIVTDVRMPMMDGIELLERVQRDFPTVIRIVLSGYFERETALRAAGAAHQYLAKPCDAVKLYQTITRLCRSNALLSNEGARGVVSAIGSLPSPPQVYECLKEALRRPEVSLSEVGRIIEQDVGMTAKVLQLANSPLFGLVCKITNVPLALGYIGLDALRELALSIEIFRSFDADCHLEDFSLNELQTHSRLAARIASRLPAEQEVIQVAVVAALLHDAGKLVLAARLPGPFQVALRRSLQEGRPLHLVEEEVIGTSHAALGAYLLSLWGLPKAIVDAVWSHHRPGAVPHASKRLDVISITHIADAPAAEFEPQLAGRWDLQYLDRLGVTDQIPAWRRIAHDIAGPMGLEAK